MRNRNLARKRPSIEILWVGEDEGDASRYRAALTESIRRPKVRHCSTMHQAIDALGQSSVSALVADISGRDDEGVGEIERARTLAPALPIIAVVSDSNESILSQVFAAGASDYVVKSSLRVADVVARVTHAIEQANRDLALRSDRALLERLALSDPLTQLLNRRGLENVVTSELDRVRRTGSSLCALFIDCDDFKRVNDTDGHDVGDTVLTAVSKTIRRAVRPMDHVARVGGDEFIVVLPEARLPEAVSVAERIRVAVAAAKFRATTVPVTVSVGVFELPRSIHGVADLMSRGTIRLKQSKEAGKNCVTADRSGRPTLVDTLDALVSGQGLTVVSQPIVELPSTQVIGMEYLCRGPEGPFHLPSDFFKLAVDGSVVEAVDVACLRACLLAAESAPLELALHVNVLPSTLRGSLAADAVDLITEAAKTRSICVEVSERQVLGEPGDLVEAVDALRAVGVRIAMDDVGSGRTALESLIVVAPDVVKIDGRWIKGIARDTQTRGAFFRLLRALHSVDADLIAEGCENHEDVEVLAQSQVEGAQGYLFGRPQAVSSGLWSDL